MVEIKSRVAHRFISSLAGITLCLLCLGGTASAQRGGGWIPAGTTIDVQTTENINTSNSAGQVFHGVVDQDVVDRYGRVVIPRGSDAELIARRVSRNEITLDLES